MLTDTMTCECVSRHTVEYPLVTERDRRCVRVIGNVRNAYIGTLLLEAEKKEMNIREFGSLAVGMGIGCWWCLDEG